MHKREFKKQLQAFATRLGSHAMTDDGQWTIKGFVDCFSNIYAISADTKIVSKLLEIHLLPQLLEFASTHDFKIVLAESQNYYPDFSFVWNRDAKVKFAVDLKTTYRLPENPAFCNGFTLGSHGAYFKQRNQQKNIQFPYRDYKAHFCLGAIYSRTDNADEKTVHNFKQLLSIASVIHNIQFFACEKWEIASDSQGSGNTANIGSIVKIDDILRGNGVFKNLGEKWFDDYWMNYRGITIVKNGESQTIRKLADFLEYRGETAELANAIERPKTRGRKDDKNSRPTD